MADHSTGRHWAEVCPCELPAEIAVANQPLSCRPNALATQCPGADSAIATKQFVGTLAVEEHDHTCVSGGAHDAPLRINARTSKWLLLVADKGLKIVEEVRHLGA